MRCSRVSSKGRTPVVAAVVLDQGARVVAGKMIGAPAVESWGMERSKVSAAGEGYRALFPRGYLGVSW